MNEHKELRLIEELMVELISHDLEDSQQFEELMNRQFELLEKLEIE